MNIFSPFPLPAFVLVAFLSVGTICVGSTPKVSSTSLPTNWKGLVPLHSTRADAERALGKPRKSRYSTSVYDTAHDRVDILYSAGPCEAAEVERWNVSRDVIL